MATSKNETSDTATPNPAGESTAAGDLRTLLAELNVATPREAIAAVRALKARAAVPQTASSKTEAETSVKEISAKEASAPTAPASGTPPVSASEAGDTRKLLEKLRVFASRIDSLNGTVASMESQLQSLYADRERLESEIGASEVDDVIQAFGDLQVTIQSMEKQLMTLYAGREVLEVELGKSDPQEIVAMFRNIAGLIGGAHQELLELNGKISHS